MSVSTTHAQFAIKFLSIQIPLNDSLVIYIPLMSTGDPISTYCFFINICFYHNAVFNFFVLLFVNINLLIFLLSTNCYYSIILCSAFITSQLDHFILKQIVITLLLNEINIRKSFTTELYLLKHNNEQYSRTYYNYSRSKTNSQISINEQVKL